MQETLRRLNHEEDIALIYFGGIRSVTDVAKALDNNCSAGVFNSAIAVAMGGAVDGDQIHIDSGYSLKERCDGVEKIIKATAQETAIIARCTGKNNLHNVEPEDMRSIPLFISKAMDTQMLSGLEKRETF